MRLRISITGREKIAEIFNGLPEKLQGKVMRPALRAGARVVLEQARHEIQSSLSTTDPPYPHLADSLHIRAMKRDRSKKGRIGVVVISGVREELGIKNLDTYYPAHIEYGHNTRKPRLDSIIMESVRRGTSARPITFTVRHVPANPFFKRALEASREAAMAAIENEVAVRIKTLVGLDRGAPDEALTDDADAVEMEAA
jgi:hypothetical protein